MITHTEDLSKKLEAFLDETWELNDLPGLAAGVWCDGFTFVGVRGYSDYENRTPLREDDIFHCASVSKLIGTSPEVTKRRSMIMSIQTKSRSSRWCGSPARVSDTATWPTRF